MNNQNIKKARRVGQAFFLKKNERELRKHT